MEAKATSVKDLTDAEVYELVYQLKQCNESDPAETRRLLQDHPELARAVAQAQLRLGMIKERTASAQAPANAIGVSNDLMEKLDPEQQELLEQVQNLAPEIIQSLPPEERRQIMELREAMGLPPL
ncbi:Transcription termination and cleavage factor C-terminal domain [Phytophthora cinnamomi]|uniref:Transcription termination and cleavage factor C-terminal domain n=1 Tax=Phytophthora cinnamomi TaxID=4785 RepID=UPI003559BC45|nr:Transcription termination and cleavage factor C-terminal domain [Phytophthora cinnamomi]